MNQIGTTLLAVSFAALNAQALEVRESPYDKIAARNLFDLHPAVTTSQTPPPVVQQLPNVKLTGITTILGKPLALLTIAATKSQSAESVILALGQAVNGIEVKAIDEKAGVVRILNGGEPQMLNFEPATSPGMQPNPIPMPPPAAPVQAKPETTMTPEEQAAIIELQRIKYQQEGNPTSAILPPTGATLNDKD